MTKFARLLPLVSVVCAAQVLAPVGCMDAEEDRPTEHGGEAEPVVGVASLSSDLTDARQAEYLGRWDENQLALAYSTIRLESESSEEERRDVVEPRLAQASVDPMSIPMAALARELGRDVTYDIRIERREGDAEAVVAQAIFVGPAVAPAGVVVDASTEHLNGAATAESIARGLALAGVPESDPEIVMYVGFVPHISTDPSEFVDWLSPRDRAVTRGELMVEGERARRALIEEAFSRSSSSFLSSTSCELIYASIATNAGWFRCSRADLALVPSLSGIRDLAISGPERVGRMTSGVDYRADTGAQMNYALAPPPSWSLHDGGTPVYGSSNSHIRVALVDPDGYYRVDDHPAYDDASGATRVTTQYRTLNGSTYVHSTGGVSGGHGTDCIAPFANLMDGQDPSISASLWPEKSYGAPRAGMVTYYASGLDMAIAIEHAVDPLNSVRADIVTTSVGTGIGTDICSISDYIADWRDAWDMAANNGALIVVPAGNLVAKCNDDCSANALATRDDVLVVGGFGIDSSPGSGAWNTDPLFGYPGTNMLYSSNCSSSCSCGDSSCNSTAECWRSAIGGAKLRYPSGVVAARSKIDLTAAHWLESTPRCYPGGTCGYSSQAGAGTSISAPLVAASMVSLLDWAGEQGFSAFSDSGFKHVNALLMTDGTRASDQREANAGAGPATSYSRMNLSWGAGRLKMRRFDSLGMNDPFAWGTGNFYLYNGQTIDVPVGSGPVNADVDEWVGVAAWDEPNITPADTSKFAAYITMSLVYTNPSGGLCPNPGGTGGQILASDTSLDTHKLIRVQSDLISSVWGKCAWIRFQGGYVPAGADGQTRRLVYRADYWEDRDVEANEPPPEIE